jgi:hypothetical protein
MKKFLLVSLLSVSVASFAAQEGQGGVVPPPAVLPEQVVAHTGERAVLHILGRYVQDNPEKIGFVAVMAYDIWKNGLKGSVFAQLAGNANLLLQDIKGAAKYVQTTGSYAIAQIVGKK